jgi:hypothetical protein
MRKGFSKFISLTASILLLVGCGSSSNLKQYTTPTSLAVLLITGSGTYSFGGLNVGTSTQTGFTVVNTGQASATSLTASLTISAFTFQGDYPGTGGTCTATLAAGASCTIVVTFAPLYVSTFQDFVTLNYNNGSTTISEEAITVSGNGLAVGP